MEHIGARIRQFREARGLTQADVYRETLRIGTPVKQSTLSSIESGTEPKAGVIGAISNAYLMLDVTWLLTGEGEMINQKSETAKQLPTDPPTPTPTAGALSVVAESEQDKWYKAQIQQKDEQIALLTELLKVGGDFSKLTKSFSKDNEEADVRPMFVSYSYQEQEQAA